MHLRSRIGSLFVAGLLVLALPGCGDDDSTPVGCGDGEPVLPEACDDGNTEDGDGCSSTCEAEHGYVCWETPSICRSSCGDGVLANNEECDDGNYFNNDGCNDNCIVEFGWICEGEPTTCHTDCGDGQVVGPEECDDGNDIDCDGCDADCMDEPTPNCGDGFLECGEQCDDGNNLDCDGCDANCDIEPATNCGDGNVECGEACDDGGESATCNDDCTLAECGDLKVNATAGEDCDASGIETATCDADCTFAVCGDNVINGAAAEACDDGNGSSGDGCSDTCTIETGWYCTGEPSVCTTTCGDGITAGTETCDDGNTTDCDGCDANCQTEPVTNCGDGNLACGEQCDDGNPSAGDGCSDTCVIEPGWYCTGTPSSCTTQCGDGVQAGTEQCDDGNLTDCDGCDSSCLDEPTPNCGDGNLECGEQCDDGNLLDEDGCNASCELEFCGDGILQTGLGEQCDEGGDTVTCDGDCTPPACGDGYTNPATGEQCDDGNLVAGDGCDAACQDECDTTLNVALTAVASSSGGGTAAFNVGPDKMNDGYGHAYCATERAHWLDAENYPTGKWIQLTWSSPQTIGRIVFDTVLQSLNDCLGSNTGRNLAGGTIQYWSGGAWVTAGSVSNQTDDWSFDFPSPVTTTQIRLYDAVAGVGGQASNPIIIEWQAFCD